MEIDGLVASYNRSEKMVNLSWNMPQEKNFSGYVIYRAAHEYPSEVVFDTASFLLAKGVHAIVKDPNKPFFQDTVGLSNVNYFYAVAAARIESISVSSEYSYDVIEGSFSNIVTVLVGSEVSFNINRGDLYVVVPECSLYINNYSDARVEKVRFTQRLRRYLVNTSNKTRIEVPNFNDPLNPPDADQIKKLKSGGWLQASGALGTNVILKEEPNFEGIEFIHSSEDKNEYSYPWILEQGNGKKRVFAEVSLINVDGSTSTQLLEDFINIRPFRAKIKIRNKMDTGDKTMRMIRLSENPLAGVSYGQVYGNELFTIYKPFVDFSVSIFADTTVADSFYYWLVVSDSTSLIDFTLANENIAWLETEHKGATLTGIGPAHNDEAVYHYYLRDSNGSTLKKLKRTKFGLSVNIVKNLPFKLLGSEIINETAVPGSYWGDAPKWYDRADTANPIKNVQKELTEVPEDLYRNFFSLTEVERYSRGRKEFAIVALFKGRFFGDTRTIFSSRNNQTGEYEMHTFFDVYPPLVNISEKNNRDYLNDDSVVAVPFNYSLAVGNEASVFDLGFARITKVDLVIARKPDTLTWVKGHTYRKFIENPHLLYSYRHIVIPFEIKTSTHVLTNVRWDNIDPTEWPSGEYIFAIITADEFGNEGIGISNTLRDVYPNPWRVRVVTGR